MPPYLRQDRKMRRLLVSSLFLATANAASVVYIGDLPAYSQLAPCVKSALKYNVQSLTNRECPEAVTELQSCVCTKNNNLPSVSSRVSSAISYSCGGTASEDQLSASTVLSAYCNQASAVSFPNPKAVSMYITDVPEVDNLAPCAKSALRYAVGTLTNDKCPPEAGALASCACSKNQNSLLVSQLINSSAKYSCSGHTADISSAQAMFAAYCQLNAGTSNFPQPSNPAGDMSYYITDLPQYSSLARCAASALSRVVQSQTNYLCPSGPQALASCACFKDGMTVEIMKDLTSSVKYSCASTATEDISSVVAVWNIYCSAAAAQLTAAGVTVSVAQTYPKGVSGSPKATGSGSSSSSSSTDGGDGDGNGRKKSTKLPLIAGAIGGVVVGLALIGAAIIFVRKSAKRRREQEQLATALQASSGPGDNKLTPHGYYGPNAGGGKAELPAVDVVAAPPPPPSPSPSTLKVNSPPRTDNVSPVSAHHTGSTAFAPPPPTNHNASLYPPMPPPNSSELPSPVTSAYPSPPFQQNNVAQPYGQGPAHPPTNAPELYGQGIPQTNRPELQGQGAMYAPVPTDRPELAGQGTQLHNPNPNRPELMGQGAMYAPVPTGRIELAGQGSHFTNANPNRPELQGQNMMFAPAAPEGRQELGGGYPPQPQQQQQQQQVGYPQQGQYQQQPYQQPQQSPYHQQHQQQSPYPQEQQQQQQGYPQQQQPIQPPQPSYQAWQAGMGMGQQQQQQNAPQPGMSWRSGPTPGLHEMDGGYEGGQGPGVAK